jgi:hypothetical protein
MYSINLHWLRRLIATACVYKNYVKYTISPAWVYKRHIFRASALVYNYLSLRELLCTFTNSWIPSQNTSSCRKTSVVSFLTSHGQFNPLTTKIGLHQAWWTFYVVRAACAKFGLHAGNITFNTQNEEWISTCINTRVILSVYFSVHHVQWKIVKTDAVTAWARVSLFVIHIYTVN